MFRRIAELRDSLLVARMLREEILGQAVAPGAAGRLRQEFLRENSAPGAKKAIEAALARGRSAEFGLVTREALVELAAALGTGEFRTHAGAPFHGSSAPAPSKAPDLFEELLETVNSPVALETWPAPVRAFGLHFLLRLVQPFQAPADVLGHAAETMVLAADHFSADHMLLAEPEIGADPAATKPDPDAFARARTHRLVERLGESRDRVRDAAARTLLAAWAERREARLNPRQARLVKSLAEKDGPPSFTFLEYVRTHAGRRAPSVRSLQRDVQALRTRGLLRVEGEGFALDLASASFGG